MREHLLSVVKECFKGVKFEELGHRYTYNNLNVPISVSGVVNKFVAKVNFDPMIQAISYRDGVSKESIRNNWHKMKMDGINKGNKVHKFAQFLGDKSEPRNESERQVLKFWKDTPQDRYIRVKREVVMYHKLFNFSGTCDFLLYDVVKQGFIIGDYKTNKDLFKNYDNRKLLYPFDSLLDCNMSKYEIQLSLYQLLIEQTGIPVVDRWLIWTEGTTQCPITEEPIQKYIKYNLPDHTNTLLEWLNRKFRIAC